MSPHLSTRDYRRLLGISIFQKRPRLHSNSLLMTINTSEKSQKPPFIWFGDALFADKLSHNQTLYCIPSGRIQIDETETFIQAMAHHCVDEILAVQPEGPYLMGGFCFDAWIAYEVAQLLAERGEVTALLAMVECYTLDRIEERFNAFAYHCQRLANGRLSESLGYLNGYLNKIIGRGVRAKQDTQGTNGHVHSNGMSGSEHHLLRTRMVWHAITLHATNACLRHLRAPGLV